MVPQSSAQQEGILERRHPPASRAPAVVIGVIFLAYAVALFLIVHAVGHRFLDGWPARVATMAGLALGMLPWARWLRPRLVRVMEALGRAALLVCYFTVLLPCALITRVGRDPLRRCRPGGPSQWLPRAPLANTLDAARAEY